MGFDFVDANDVKAKQALTMKFDFILSTVPSNYELQPYVNMLNIHGKMYCQGLPNQPQQLLAPTLTFANRTLTGTVVGTIADHQEVLDYCAEHSIYPEVEVINADETNLAIEKLRNSTGKFRYVIDMSTLTKNTKMK